MNESLSSGVAALNSHQCLAKSNNQLKKKKEGVKPVCVNQVPSFHKKKEKKDAESTTLNPLELPRQVDYPFSLPPPPSFMFLRMCSCCRFGKGNF